MTSLQAFLAAIHPGMDIVAGCAGLSEKALISAGAPDKTAQQLLALYDVYFGRTAFTRRQRDSVAAAQRLGHSLPTIEVIERYAIRAKTQRAAWQMREELCNTKADTLAMEQVAKKKLKALNSERKPEQGVKLYRRKDKPWTLAITGPSTLIADMHAAIDPASPLESLENLFFPAAKDSTSVPSPTGERPRIHTNVIVQLPALAKILQGDGEEISLQMTNGAIMSGAEYVKRALDTCLDYATLVHPHEGPVNLYRTKRFANRKQRLMAGAENPTCAWPGCNHPADKAQVHHLISWSRGGPTNMSNLATLCHYHNGVNEDEPNAPPLRGRLARVDGKVRWQRG